MGIEKNTLYIEKTANLCYCVNMIMNFESKLTYNGISFQRSTCPSIAEREIHSYHEILFCMDADAVFLTENRQMKVQGNALFLIPKEKYHYFRIQGGNAFSRLKIYFPAEQLNSTPCGDVMREIRVFENVDGSCLLLLKKLCRVMEEPENDKQGFYAYSIFLMLLTELDWSSPFGGILQEKQNAGELSRMIGYISEHLSEDLTVTALAQKMNLSESGVSHLFKREMGIPVHQYVTQRRLVYAQSLLEAGKRPTMIYADCGYKDYSSFYKAYCLHFGYPPSCEGKEKIRI